MKFKTEWAEDTLIFSGEGERGASQRYLGKKTRIALRSRLTTERCNGDRWAYAMIELPCVEYAGMPGLKAYARLDSDSWEIDCSETVAIDESRVGD